MKKLCLAFILLVALTLTAAETKTKAIVVAPESPGKSEQAAIAELNIALDRIGIGGGIHRVFIGKTAPSDRKPLADGERRIKSEGNDLYIYGEGKDGAAFAVYDFMDRFLGCRWYSIWDTGEGYQPRQKDLRFGKIDFSLKPSFDFLSLSCGTWAVPQEYQEKYQRRNRIYLDGLKTPLLGPNYIHTPGQFIPPGKQYKVQAGLWVPYKYFKDDAYFGEHPEYFAQNKAGERIPDRQLCYSNSALRSLLTEKLEYIISQEYKGGQAIMYCDLNDDNGFAGETICHCQPCMELVKKYRSPAGPYWDYLFELSSVFSRQHPQISLVALAYLCTETAPAVEKIPDNIVISIWPLNKNYLKPFDHPTNERVVRRLKEWTAISSRVWVQLYASVYPRSATTHPLLANVHQLVRNIRICKELGVAAFRTELGYGVYDRTGFNPLRMWLMAQLANDITLDESKLIRDFMNDMYGKAAPAMLEYYRELERLEAAEETGLNWMGISGAFSYLTTANLSRWDRDFDRMEKTVAGDPARQQAVRLVRTDLDEAILSVYPRLPKSELPDFAQVMNRVRHTLEDQADFIASKQVTPKMKKWIAKYLRDLRITNGIDFFQVYASTPKPLPPPLDGAAQESVLRVLPGRMLNNSNFSLAHLLPDEQATFGKAMKCNKKPQAENRIFIISHYNPAGDKFWTSVNDQKRIKLEDLSRQPDAYRLYHVGRSRLFPQSYLSLSSLDNGGIAWLGHLFDPQHPDMMYDIYVSARYTKENELWIDQIVLVKRGESTEVQKTENAPAAG